MLLTHLLQTKASYVDAVIKGGERLEEDAWERTSSLSLAVSRYCLSTLGWYAASGEGVREVGRSRRLRHDS
jgi:hypothetical protein